jgi:glyoxylate carboligase
VGLGWWAKKKVDSVRSEIEKTPEGRTAMQAMKEGATRGEGGLTGAMTGLAGASIGLTSGAVMAQAIPSLTPAEQEDAKAVFKTLSEKGARMKKEDFEAYSQALQRFSEATEPARKAKQAALEQETDPSRKVQMAMDMMKVEPEHARRLVADLKALAANL